MSERGIYQGYALQQVDAKGRVAIPSSLRDTLIANTPPRPADSKDAPNVLISTHESDLCLIGFDRGYQRARVEDLVARQREHSGAKGALDANILRDGMGVGEPLPFDASGRFILPAFPRARAKIGKYAFFFGLGYFFEIWDPATLVASDTASPVMKDAVRFFMAERGEKL